MTTETKTFERCVHLFGIHEVHKCTKLGIECPSPKKCYEKHGDKHYKPIEWDDSDQWNFWGF